MKCPKCKRQTALRGRLEIAPFSGAVERLDCCICGWWLLVFLGWADQMHRPVQLALFSETELEMELSV